MASAVWDERVSQTFKELSELEKVFSDVEISSLRRKEFALKALYAQRQALLNSLESFWHIVFQNAPEEVSQFLTAPDLEILARLKSFSVERYQLHSEVDGEPRSLRFTFEFDENEFFEDAKLVKELEYRCGPGVGAFMSTPIQIKWKGKKKDPTKGLLNAAVELYQAEQALQGDDAMVDSIERQSLWQNEKLRELLVKADETEDDLSFFCWFGFRGVVAPDEAVATEDGSDDDESEGEDMLDVEIFPPGEELALALTDDLWTNAPVCFTQAFQEYDLPSNEGSEDDSDAEGDVPDLVPLETDRPSKKRRIS